MSSASHKWSELNGNNFHTIYVIIDTSLSLKLSSWKNELPSEIDISKSSSGVPQPHQLMLHLTYYWLIILLHRPFYRRRRSCEDLEGYTDHVKVCAISFMRFLR
jgi:hypothetical protein